MSGLLGDGQRPNLHLLQAASHISYHIISHISLLQAASHMFRVSGECGELSRMPKTVRRLGKTQIQMQTTTNTNANKDKYICKQEQWQIQNTNAVIRTKVGRDTGSRRETGRSWTSCLLRKKLLLKLFSNCCSVLQYTNCCCVLEVLKV